MSPFTGAGATVSSRPASSAAPATLTRPELAAVTVGRSTAPAAWRKPPALSVLPAPSASTPWLTNVPVTVSERPPVSSSEPPAALRSRPPRPSRATGPVPVSSL